MMRHLLKDPQFKDLVKERWRPQPIDLSALKTLPEGSFGRCYEPADQSRHHPRHVD